MRTIDRILDLVRDMEGLSPTDREVLRARIEPYPQPAEIEAAKLRLYPSENTGIPWVKRITPEDPDA